MDRLRKVAVLEAITVLVVITGLDLSELLACIPVSHGFMPSHRFIFRVS